MRSLFPSLIFFGLSYPHIHNTTLTHRIISVPHIIKQTTYIMNSAALTAISSTTLVASGAIWFLTGYRYSTQYVMTRTPLFLFGMLLASVNLVLSTASVLLLKSALVRVAVQFTLTAVLLATYNTRLAIMLDFVKFSYFEKKRFLALFFSTVFFGSCAFYLSPMVVLWFHPEKAAAAMGVSTIINSVSIIGFCLYVFREAGRDIYQIKRESLSVLAVTLLNWCVLTPMFLIPSLNFGARGTAEAILWVNFSCSFCVFYFAVLLPLISSFKEKNTSLVARSRIISERLLESENSFDDTLLHRNDVLEAILFFKQVHELANEDKEKSEKNMADDKIHDIYKNYLSESANLGLSVPPCITRKIESKLDREENLDISIFDEAIEYVWNTVISKEAEDENGGCTKNMKKNTLRYLFWES